MGCWLFGFFSIFWARLLFFCVWHRCSFGNKIWITIVIVYLHAIVINSKPACMAATCMSNLEGFFIVHVFSMFQLASYFHNIQSNKKALWVNAHSLAQKCLKTEFNINAAFKTCARCTLHKVRLYERFFLTCPWLNIINGSLQTQQTESIVLLLIRWKHCWIGFIITLLISAWKP